MGVVSQLECLNVMAGLMGRLCRVVMSAMGSELGYLTLRPVLCLEPQSGNEELSCPMVPWRDLGAL